MTNKSPQLIKISASAVKTYEQCPRKYYYNYIKKIPTKQWEHFDLGNLCHKTLEIFHEIYMKDGTSKKSLNSIMSHAFATARKEFPRMRKPLVAEAKELITTYLLSMKQNGMPNVKGVEKFFSFNLTKNILIRGYLDRLDISKDGKFHIIDYKTTKNVKYLDDFQLLIYGLWLQREYPETDSFKGSYVLLRHGSKLKSYDFNKEDIERVRKELISYADTIRKEDEWTPIPTILCNWCDFKSICPAQQAW